jgi:hypothetical protein
LQTLEHRRIVESLYRLTEYCDFEWCRELSPPLNLTYVFPAKINRNILCKFYSKTIKSKATERKQEWSNNDHGFTTLNDRLLTLTIKYIALGTRNKGRLSMRIISLKMISDTELSQSYDGSKM